MNENEKHKTFEDAFVEREKKCQEYASSRESNNYMGTLLYIQNITREFLHCILSVNLLATRFKSIADDMLLLRSMDHITESAVTIELLIRSGCLNPAKREMRYMLEASIKYLYTDQQFTHKNYEEKLFCFHNEVPRCGINLPKNIDLNAFDQGTMDEFKQDYINFYGQASSIVHPSLGQIQEHERRSKRGSSIGFESPKELESLSKLCFQLYDMVMVLLLHGVGLSSAGDFFITFVDETPKYHMLKGKYFKKMNQYFDYKEERKIKK